MTRHDLRNRARNRDKKANFKTVAPPWLQHHRHTQRHSNEREFIACTNDHCLIVPNVTPRRRCFRTNTVNSTIGATKISAPADTCGQGLRRAPGAGAHELDLDSDPASDI